MSTDMEVAGDATKLDNMYISLALQVLGGSLVFVLVFVPAILLDWLISWLSGSHAVSHSLLFIIKGAKMVLLVLDCVMGGAFIASHVFKFLVLAWKDIQCAMR